MILKRIKRKCELFESLVESFEVSTRNCRY